MSIQKERLTHIFVKADYRIVNIVIKNITYIQSQSDYVKFYLENGTNVMSLMSMKTLEEMLQNTDIIRVHRSYFVNIKRISYIANQTIVIGNQQIPLGDSYKTQFFDCINQQGL